MLCPRRHVTSKPVTSPTYSREWSGVTGAPRCKSARCPKCAGCLHHEGGSHYCPTCDDYKHAEGCQR
jgi:hypothetical protein